MYKLSVSREGLNKRKRTGNAMHAVVGLLLLLYTISYYERLNSVGIYFVILPVIVALLSIFYPLYLRKRDKRHLINSIFRLEQAVCLCAVAIAIDNIAPTIVLANLYLLAALCLYLLFIERQFVRYNYLLITTTGLVVPNLFGSRKIHWPQVSDVVLRPDFVTIFLAKDKFLQTELTNRYSERQLKEIQSFCNEQLHLATKISYSHN